MGCHEWIKYFNNAVRMLFPDISAMIKRVFINMSPTIRLFQA